MKQVTAVLIGAGLRGREAYASYALRYPAELKIIGVAEPEREKRELLAMLHGIELNNQYESYEELLQQKKMADCALICTQDNEHYEPVMLALEKGYHILCEKPMSKNPKELLQMAQLSRDKNKVLSICHVLRYSAFFMKIKEMLETGKIGKLETIQHIENVGYWHYAHSFVRGAWRNEQQTSPMILAKCCHDMDILSWLADSRCKTIHSFGEHSFFKEENAPSGATKYCLDGCSHRDDCPYYAPRFYLSHPKAEEDCLIQAVSINTTPHVVMEKLRSGPYGRCVFYCDNNVVEHQVINLEFQNGVHVSFTMSAFTYDCHREINLMGTMGQIKGDMETGRIIYYDFRTGNKETIILNTKAGGHSGSDETLMKDFVQLVSQDGRKAAKTSADVSVDSHLMALAAEESRLEGKVLSFCEYKRRFLE